MIAIENRDCIDLKLYEPAMRTLIDTYIRAQDSVKVSAVEWLEVTTGLPI